MIAGLRTELPYERSIVLNVSPFENLIDLHCGLLSLKALLNDIGRELELAKSDEVTSYEVENLIISFLVIKFENVLYKIVSVRIFDE